MIICIYLIISTILISSSQGYEKCNIINKYNQRYLGVKHGILNNILGYYIDLEYSNIQANPKYIYLSPFYLWIIKYNNQTNEYIISSQMNINRCLNKVIRYGKDEWRLVYNCFSISINKGLSIGHKNKDSKIITYLSAEKNKVATSYEINYQSLFHIVCLKTNY